MVIDSLDVLAALSKLTEDQREALIDSVILGRGDKAIAETMGLSPARVYQLRDKAIERMRNTRLTRLYAA